MIIWCVSSVNSGTNIWAIVRHQNRPDCTCTHSRLGSVTGEVGTCHAGRIDPEGAMLDKKCGACAFRAVRWSHPASSPACNDRTSLVDRGVRKRLVSVFELREVVDLGDLEEYSSWSLSPGF